MSLRVGQVVLVEFDGAWLPAEITAVKPNTCSIFWFDGDGPLSRVGLERIKQIDYIQKTSHRFAIGEPILCPSDNRWWFATVTGLTEYGYSVKYADDTHGYCLELAAISRRARSDDLKPGSFAFVRAGGEQNCFPASILSIINDDFFIRWAIGGDEKVRRADIVAGGPPRTLPLGLPILEILEEASRPSEPRQFAPTNFDTATTASSQKILQLQNHLARRLQDKDLKASEELIETWCPACQRDHDVSWFRDRRYEINFFICQSMGEVAIIHTTPNDGLKVWAPNQFMEKFPAAAGYEKPFLSRIMGMARVDITPLPPFVRLSLAKNRSS